MTYIGVINAKIKLVPKAADLADECGQLGASLSHRDEPQGDIMCDDDDDNDDVDYDNDENSDSSDGLDADSLAAAAAASIAMRQTKAKVDNLVANTGGNNTRAFTGMVHEKPDVAPLFFSATREAAPKKISRFRASKMAAD